MEILNLEKDILVFCLLAKSFPDGAKEAHEKLHGLVPFSQERNYFGISYPKGHGQLEYKAAVSELPGESLKDLNLEEFVLNAGRYLYIDVEEFMENIPKIGTAFNALIQDKRIDPNGFCLEWYLENNTCRCMVPLIN